MNFPIAIILTTAVNLLKLFYNKYNIRKRWNDKFIKLGLTSIQLIRFIEVPTKCWKKRNWLGWEEKSWKSQVRGSTKMDWDKNQRHWANNIYGRWRT